MILNLFKWKFKTTTIYVNSCFIYVVCIGCGFCLCHHGSRLFTPNIPQLDILIFLEVWNIVVILPWFFFDIWMEQVLGHVFNTEYSWDFFLVYWRLFSLSFFFWIFEISIPNQFLFLKEGLKQITEFQMPKRWQWWPRPLPFYVIHFRPHPVVNPNDGRNILWKVSDLQNLGLECPFLISSKPLKAMRHNRGSLLTSHDFLTLVLVQESTRRWIHPSQVTEAAHQVCIWPLPSPRLLVLVISHPGWLQAL